MTEKSTVTIRNDRPGKLVLPPDADELRAYLAIPEGKRKASDKPKNRILASGESITVNADEAPKFLRYRGIVDLSKIVATAESAEVKALKAKLAASEAENVRLRSKRADKAPIAPEAETNQDDEAKAQEKAAKDAAKAAAAERKKIIKKGAKVVLPDGGTGVVQKFKPGKKGPADDEVDVKLDVNGNVSPFLVSSLKAAPLEAVAS